MTQTSIHASGASDSPIGAPASSCAPAVTVQQLSHTYGAGARRALDQISLQVQTNEWFGLLGPNGSGKTTLFRILTTLLRPSAGRVRVFDCDVVDQSALVRAHLGVVFQNPSLDVQLTAQENLHHHGRLYGLARGTLKQRIDEGLARFGLTDRRHERISQFSGGMRRRLELAKAMLHRPNLLLLDEPATGLDPGARRELWRDLEALRQQGVAIIMTTHLMEAADRCDRLAILSQGELVALDSPDRLKASIGGEVVTVAPVNDAEQLAKRITDRFGPWPSDGEPTVVDRQVRCQRPDGARFVALLNEALPGQIQRVSVGRPTLEDVFCHLTGHTLWSQPNHGP